MTTASALDACLDPLLNALHWRRTKRQRVEAVGKNGHREFSDLRNTMANLGFASRVERTAFGALDPRLLPCLFLPEDGGALVVLNAVEAGDGLGCFDGKTGLMTLVDDPDRRGLAGFFELDQASAGMGSGTRQGWLRALLERFESVFLRLLGMSFILSLLALAPALFVYAVYDRVLGTAEYSTLAYLAMGVALAILADTALRVLRGAALAHVGARLDFLVGTGVIRKLLSLPLARLEKSSIGAQFARLRESEGLRGVFVGPLALAFLELPFIAVFIAAIAAIGGYLALVPIFLTAILIVAGLAAIRYVRHAARRAAAQGDHQALLVEILSAMRTIKAGAAETIWFQRYRERSAQAAFIQLRQARVAALTENLAQSINFIAGAATLAFGATLAMNGTISTGALIASMVLVWRALAPVQSLFLAVARLEDVGHAARGVDQMMTLPSEAGFDGARPTIARGRRFAGRIQFQRAVLRYGAQADPALAGVSFDVKPGQIVALTGGNGSGKSSILKLVANLYQPQAGAVLIDGVDVRQLNPADLRHSIAYLPQHADLFAGTIADNLRLAQPGADDGELRAACTKAGAMDAIDALPAGFNTPANDQLPAEIVRRLALARAYLTDASIVLLDEPCIARDETGEDLLLRQLDALRGRATVLIVTHHPAYMRAADRVIALRQGVVVHDNPPKQLIAKIAGAST